MTTFEKLALRALGALLYLAVYRDDPIMRRQGHVAREKLIAELRDAVHGRDREVKP